MGTEDELITDIAGFAFDPLGFVYYAFPWGEPGTELEHSKGPEPWQIKLLSYVGEQLRAGLMTVEEAVRYIGAAILVAVASGHGIGKSALVSWIILWALSTCVDTKVVVTANTSTQLETKTWAELAKWHRLAINAHWFEYTATSLHSTDPAHEKTWRADAIPWKKEKSEAFAGLHNQGKRIVVVFDEASAIEDVIFQVSEGALTDKDTEILWFLFGNPTRATGRFHAAFHKLRHRWKTWQVDSRTVSISNKEQIKNWAEDYGEDSDFFKVRVKGEFPNQSDWQFIPTNIAEAARGRHLRVDQYNFAARIIGVDPSWGGGDEFAIFFRQGLMSKLLAVFPKNEDDFAMAGVIAKFEEQLQADAVFIDLGWGTGIYSAGKQMGRNWTLVAFGGESTDPGFLNKRSEMWGLMKQWLKDGGAIPDDTRLGEELISPEYGVVATGPNTGKTFLESKKDMRARGLPSPNRADALCLTFAFPVVRRQEMVLPGRGGGYFAKSQYDVLNRR